MSKKWKPVGFRILVKPEEDRVEKELGQKVEGGYQRESGIFIVENSDTESEILRESVSQQYGIVVDIGPIAWYDYADGQKWCKIGDRVCFSKHAGKFIEDPITKKMLIAMNDSDIILVEEEIDNANN